MLNLVHNLLSFQMDNAKNVINHVVHVKMLLTNVQLVLKDSLVIMKNVFHNVLLKHLNLIIPVLLVPQIVKHVLMLIHAHSVQLNIYCKELNVNLNVMMDIITLIEHALNVLLAVLLVLDLTHVRHVKMDLNSIKVIAHLDVLMANI